MIKYFRYGNQLIKGGQVVVSRQKWNLCNANIQNWPFRAPKISNLLRLVLFLPPTSAYRCTRTYRPNDRGAWPVQENWLNAASMQTTNWPNVDSLLAACLRHRHNIKSTSYKLDTLIQCWINVRPASQTVVQHLIKFHGLVRLGQLIGLLCMRWQNASSAWTCNVSLKHVLPYPDDIARLWQTDHHVLAGLALRWSPERASWLGPTPLPSYR